jgi:hypothetical protein
VRDPFRPLAHFFSYFVTGDEPWVLHYDPEERVRALIREKFHLQTTNIPTFKVEDERGTVVFYKKFKILQESKTGGITVNCVNSAYRFWEDY